MFKPVFPDQGKKVTIYVEDNPVTVDADLSVAAAVLRSGSAVTGTSARGHRERGPYCQMGVCCECLMEIDGRPNQQSCLILVREGMRVRRQNGAPRYSSGDSSL